MGCYHIVEEDEREMRGGTGGPVHARVLDIFDRHRNIIFPHLEKVRRGRRGARAGTKIFLSSEVETNLLPSSKKVMVLHGWR